MRVRGWEQIWLHHPLATSTSRSFTALHLTLLICKMGQQKQLLHSKVRVTQKLAQAQLSSWPPALSTAAVWLRSPDTILEPGLFSFWTLETEWGALAGLSSHQ